jgi:rhodanese-related sulfurtransferase
MRLSLSLLLPLALLAACSREPAVPQSRVAAALTPPAVIADWIIQGRNDFALFDLRDPAAFAKGHLPAAVQVDPAKLREPGIVRALPDYKTLVFYGTDDSLHAEVLAPLFARGLHVMIVQGGYAGWQRHVLTRPQHATTPELAKQDAVARYFRGESVLGTAAPLKGIRAEQFLRPPALPAARPAPTYESEGC